MFVKSIYKSIMLRLFGYNPYATRKEIEPTGIVKTTHPEYNDINRWGREMFLIKQNI